MRNQAGDYLDDYDRAYQLLNTIGSATLELKLICGRVKDASLGQYRNKKPFDDIYFICANLLQVKSLTQKPDIADNWVVTDLSKVVYNNRTFLNKYFPEKYPLTQPLLKRKTMREMSKVGVKNSELETYTEMSEKANYLYQDPIAFANNIQDKDLDVSKGLNSDDYMTFLQPEASAKKANVDIYEELVVTLKGEGELKLTRSYKPKAPGL